MLMTADVNNINDANNGEADLPVTDLPPEPQQILEALLFASDEVLPPARLKAIIPGQPDARHIRKMIDDVNKRLQQQRHPFEIAEVAGGYVFRSVPNFGPWVKQLFKGRTHKRLSAQALECLAIVAYKQPMTKAEIEAVRGVVSDGALKTLLERRLVTIAGRSEKPGRPLLYATTKEFLSYFGLKRLSDMPRIEEFEEMAKERMGEIEEEVSEREQLLGSMEQEGSEEERATEDSDTQPEASAETENGAVNQGSPVEQQAEELHDEHVDDERIDTDNAGEEPGDAGSSPTGSEENGVLPDAEAEVREGVSGDDHDQSVSGEDLETAGGADQELAKDPPENPEPGQDAAVADREANPSEYSSPGASGEQHDSGKSEDLRGSEEPAG